ncbi:type II toxin-antitoxin system prevent-host-death family antitoxin [Patescibacteria group bacterium]|nr:type II toxin-antitoxin system prevent-host-death family antitoxin [Patescibacteria group bacterium]
MDIKTTLPISEARKKIFKISDDVQRPGRHYTLTEKGRPKVVMMSAEEYESMIETMEVERIFPNLDKDIAEVKKAIKTGAYKKWATLDELKRDWGFSVADKPIRKYGVRTSNNKKGKRKAR